MKKKRRNTKLVLWSALTLALVTLGGASIYIYVNHVKPQEDLKAQLEKNPPIGVTEELGAMIRESHEAYNELTGFGNIDDLDQDKAITLSKLVYKRVEDALEEGIADKQLEADLKAIHQLVKETSMNPEQEKVRLAHRYFHDLDIAVNQYEETNTIFGVTETLGKP